MVGRDRRSFPRTTLTALLLATILSSGDVAVLAQGTHTLLVSGSRDRSSPVALEGLTVAGDIYVFVSPESGVSSLRFFVDDPTMAGAPYSTDTASPYDLAGTGKKGTALAFDTTQLADGTHTVTAAIDLSAGGTETVTSSFTVGNGSPALDQVHLSWVEDPATTMTVAWRTFDPAAPSSVQIRELGATSWQTVTGAARPSGTSGALHEATARSLAPSTAYEYRVGAGGSAWSEVFTTRTAPLSGPATFDVVYVADTGIAGRTDGLTTGTEQVIEEIAALDPLVVLLGGDYAYFDTETRFATLDEAIDAWFNQMQPIGARSPMMVTYGNHEIKLGEGFEPWAARFPTPEGVDDRRTYSFDVGDAHFVSILAVNDKVGLPSTTLEWIEQDIAAAQAAGARWVIPFFHVSPFADGTVHPSNLELRAQLGPLFERLDVPLVISSHDQSYERTFPLADVPATNTPTSTSLGCYTPEDGVTWVKVSPGGKLSNRTGGFSTFTTHPPPPWTAVRDDTMHHFLRIRLSSDGSIRVEAFGVEGDGSPPVVLDAFTLTSGACPGGLGFEASSMSLAADQGGQPAVAEVMLDTLDGSVASYVVAADAGWLTVEPASGSTPVPLSLTADPSGLAPGTYTATLIASAPGYIEDRLTVSFTVSGAFRLLLSPSPDRSSPVVLEGQTVAGDIYVFVSPESGVSSVRFFVDDPTMAGTPAKTEKNAPWDFGGTASNGLALPFDTSTLSDGVHSVTAAIQLESGSTEVVTSTFTVGNGGSP